MAPNPKLEPYVLTKAKREALEKANQRRITVRFGDGTERVVLADGFGVFDRQRQRSSQRWQGFESGSDIQAIIRSVGKPPNGAPPKVALKFQTRFRISRRAEPEPMEGVHSFFDPGWINITESGTGYSFQLRDQFGNYLQQEIRREDCLGEFFHFQDGDEVTLYPLPAP